MNKNEPQPRRALGKGVGALLPTRPPSASASPTPPAADPGPSETPYTVPVDSIDANPLQPRRVFEPAKLQELAQSIAHNGIVQPLVVRHAPNAAPGEPRRYQLIAGERRLRAAKIAKLTTVPVVVREIDDRQLLQITLIENIQREDLNSIETAVAFQRLAADLHLTMDDIAAQTGKDRTTIVNFIRLLSLPDDIQQLVADKKLSAGHARCLLRLPTPEIAREVAQKALAQGWSVRHIERFTQNYRPADAPTPPAPPPPDPNTRAAIEEMERALGTKVRIQAKRKGGRIEIEYYSVDDLHRIYAAIVGEP